MNIQEQAKKLSDCGKEELREARGFFKEYREFISRGSVVDMAVGVVIGAAFGKIITSLVNDLIMPLVGWIFGSGQFKELSVTLREATETQAAVVFGYGAFIQNIVDFLLIAFCVFVFVRIINRFRRKSLAAKKAEEEAQKAKETAQAEEEKALQEERDNVARQTLRCLTDIRESLQK